MENENDRPDKVYMEILELINKYYPGIDTQKVDQKITELIWDLERESKENS